MVHKTNSTQEQKVTWMSGSAIFVKVVLFTLGPLEYAGFRVFKKRTHFDEEKGDFLVDDEAQLLVGTEGRLCFNTVGGGAENNSHFAGTEIAHNCLRWHVMEKKKKGLAVRCLNIHLVYSFAGSPS